MTLRTYPPMPGSVVRIKIINAMGIKQADLAKAMGISNVRINQILSGHSRITPQMALRLDKVTGISAEYWLSLQCQFDLFQARQQLASELEKLPRLRSAKL
jgi:addiction module HigA family antidote